MQTLPGIAFPRVLPSAELAIILQIRIGADKGTRIKTCSFRLGLGTIEGHTWYMFVFFSTTREDGMGW